MVGDISAWVNLQSVITTVLGSLLVGAALWGLRRLGKWQEGRKPPNPITEETNERLTGLLDAIERENKSAVTNLIAAKDTIKTLEQQLTDEKAAHKSAIADYDQKYSETQIALAKLAIRNTQLAARLDQVEAAYTRDTGKVLPPIIGSPT